MRYAVYISPCCEPSLLLLLLLLQCHRHRSRYDLKPSRMSSSILMVPASSRGAAQVADGSPLARPSASPSALHCLIPPSAIALPAVVLLLSLRASLFTVSLACSRWQRRVEGEDARQCKQKAYTDSCCLLPLLAIHDIHLQPGLSVSTRTLRVHTPRIRAPFHKLKA